MPDLGPTANLIALSVGTVLVLLLVILLIFSRMYKRASKEVSFVRTGFGGQQVIINGGALVFPVFHEIIPVNMNTLRLEVRRANEQALITADRMRVDVTAEFYVRAKPTADAIANAAQTLGMKTMNPGELKGLVEGKFVDALRAVAAEMAMEQLHERRVDFVQKVQQVVSEDLLKNGLELESVSLTALDQTSFEHFNPQNAFDAEGLTRLTQAIESRRKVRNDIEQDTQVQIQAKNLEAEREKLEIARETEYARLKQEREIEIRKAAQNAEVASEQAEKQRDAESASINADREVQTARILAEREVEAQRIEKERSVEKAEVERRQTIELAEQDRAIAVAERSRAESEASAEADRARAVAVKEEEAVATVRDVERATRQKEVELVMARQVADKAAISVTTAAEAEKQAADDQAEAVRLLAEAEANKARITARGESDAELMRAEAASKRYEVDAAGKQALNEAANLLSDDQISMQIRLSLIERLASIVRESVKPMEQIEGIKIINVSGLGAEGGGGAGASGPAANDGNVADQLVSSALRYRAQGPLIDSLLKEVGLGEGGLDSLVSRLGAGQAEPGSSDSPNAGGS